MMNIDEMKDSLIKIQEWINCNDCGCEYSFDSYSACCGKDKNILEMLEELTRAEHVRPRFRDLTLPQRDEILTAVERLKADISGK